MSRALRLGGGLTPPNPHGAIIPTNLIPNQVAGLPLDFPELDAIPDLVMLRTTERHNEYSVQVY
jgi:hypothetical protein